MEETRMSLLEIMKKRRSIRSYTGEKVPGEMIEKVLQAGRLAPSSFGNKAKEFIVVRDKDTLTKMADAREGAADMLKGADAAIVVISDETITDVWTEDCSIAMAHMYLMADDLGLGSCWIQGRLRRARTGESTEEYLRKLLGFPESHRLAAILSIGMPAKRPAPRDVDTMPEEKIHFEKY